ncbi:molybdopterin-dependent oxidoreductase [Marichromatium gracile]|uniref:molybdopterin-containing oxidoreductase family protein n=1 Tax=Marichromatium gracile TaxID=1048 RepID=UPI001F3E3C0E|nr:molybdopterin-dependent oxidoreductase [Marichromatium gracile]MCF1182784.1 molybdopterin-dependent oxidoreductase [Marichromatium gracile]
MRRTHRSVCRICHGGCGALVTVEDGRVVKVVGDRDSPMNQGWMCVKGLRTPEIANHPDRLEWPRRRRAGKAGGWARVSWEAALDEIAERVAAIRDRLGPEAIALGQGTGRHHYMHVVRFANALGTPNWYEPGLAQCFIPRVTVSNLTYGGYVTGDYYGDTPPACILFWGSNPLVSNPDGKIGIAIRRALDRGAVGIAVDPRRHETARRCELWLGLRPGTDAALALAMIQVIIAERRYDAEFVARWTQGFDALAAHVADCTPDWAAPITGVAPELIVEAARRYAAFRPAVLEWGVGIEQNVNALQTVRALACLRALVGSIDVPGGELLSMQRMRAYPTLAEQLPREQARKRLGAERFKLLGGWRAYMPSAHIPTLFAAMRTGEPYPVKGLLVFGNNALATVANAREVRRSLECLDLLVVSELFMTPTAELADFVLPAAFWPEVEQVIGYPLATGNLVYHQPALTRRGECRPDEWIIDQLSRRLGLPDSERPFEAVMAHQLEPTGVGLDQLRRQGVLRLPHRYRKYETRGFRTPSRRIELYSKALERLGYDPLPSHVEPPESPRSRPDLARDYPYVLITGSRRREFFNSEHRQVAGLRRRAPDPRAQLHPEVARAEGIADGDWVAIATPRGRIRMRAEVTPEINPEVVSIDHGWWFPEAPSALAGAWRANANLLTSDAPPYDPAFGTYQLRGLLCRLAPASAPAADEIDEPDDDPARA